MISDSFIALVISPTNKAKYNYLFTSYEKYIIMNTVYIITTKTISETKKSQVAY